jgi:hypothetical protein
MVRNVKGVRSVPRSRVLRRLVATQNATYALTTEMNSQARPVPSGR